MNADQQRIWELLKRVESLEKAAKTDQPKDDPAPIPTAINDDPMAANREVLLAQMKNQTQDREPDTVFQGDCWLRLEQILETVRQGRIPSAAQEDDCLELLFFLKTISRLHRDRFP